VPVTKEKREEVAAALPRSHLETDRRPDIVAGPCEFRSRWTAAARIAAHTPESSSMDNLSQEHSFLKAPCEVLAKSFRARQRVVHKELQALAASAAALGPAPTEQQLAAISARVESLKAVLASTEADETAATDRCEARLEHLKAKPRASQRSALSPSTPWDKTRLDRMLVDYMLRRGFDDSAAALASSEGILDLVELNIFAASRAVADDLERRSCTAALQWCADNRRRLSRMDSSLEFRLHIQEFVELVRHGNKSGAIKYVRSNMVGNTMRIAAVQQAMALLAFGPGTDCAPYKDMYSDERWTELIEAFRQDNYRLHGLPRESVLETTLKAGLSTLKMVHCGTTEGLNSNCPTCVEPYLSLARDLPRARHVHSVLVCGLSKCIMDENNPPMVLPNGNVYGNDALVKLSASNNGVIVDPRTSEEFPMSELRRAFIM
jgi:macrophage erythroblast attacher